VFHADKNNQNSGRLNVTRGGAQVSWQSLKPLSYVIGWCGAAGYALQPRTCAGVDSPNGNVNTNVACDTNVSLKVCPKKTNAKPV